MFLQIFAVSYHGRYKTDNGESARETPFLFYRIACLCPSPPTYSRRLWSLFVIVNRDLHNWSSPCCHLNLGKYTKNFLSSSYIQLLSYVAYPEQSSVNCNLTFCELYFCNKIMAKVRDNRIYGVYSMYSFKICSTIVYSTLSIVNANLG